jgi:phage virion morphogenesis protein
MAGGASIHLDLNTDAVAGALARAAARSANMHPLMEMLGAAILSSTQQRFLDEVGPDGQKWPPSIRVQLGGGNTLRDTGRLFQSLTYQADESSVEVGTNLIYAGVHQFGATIRAKSTRGLRFRVGDRFVTRKSVQVPARPFLGIDDADRYEIAIIVEDWLSGLAEGSVQ